MKKFNVILIFILLSSLVFSALILSSSMANTNKKTDVKIYNLVIDNLKNPVGIDNKVPYFSWKMESSIIGEKQMAYQIIVKKLDNKTKQAVNTVWDTHKVVSDTSNYIPYKGKALESSTTYVWSVQAWDKDGVKVTSEEKAYFEMGLLEPNSFNDAHWISNTTHEKGTPMFRKSFHTKDKKIISAKTYSTALGVYDLYFNGKRVGRTDENNNTIYDEMKPGWTDYNQRVLYYTYDITNLVKQNDKNVILSLVTSGWWSGRISYNTYGSKNLAFLSKTIITYDDNTKDIIATDDSWKSSKDSVIREADIWDGEIYDATLLNPSEISDTSYNDASWSDIKYSTDFKGVISAQVGPSVRVRKDISCTPKGITVYRGIEPNGSDYGKIHVVKSDYTAAVKISLKAGQKIIFDLGQNMVGWPNITFKGPKNTKIDMNFAEMLNDSGQISRGNDGPQGSLYTTNYRSAKSTATYFMNGTESGESYHSTFSFYGFRYVSLIATNDIEITNFSVEILGSENTELGKVETSSKDINQLFSNVLWGQRSNYLSVPTDCPQRDERLGWSGDTQIFANAASYNANVDAFFHKWSLDAMDSQIPSGAYSDTIPASAAVGAGGSAWSDAGIIVPYIMYKMYGDIYIINKMYTSMTKYMDYLSLNKLEGGAQTYGDWLAYEDTPKHLISIAYYAYDAKLMAEMSAAIGKKAESNKYLTLYKQIKNKFQSIYINSDGSMNVASQTAYLLALKMDLLPTEDSKQQCIKALVQKIKYNNKLSTGFVGTGIIAQTLSSIGETDMAYTLLLQRNNPSWLYSIDQGATTIWERWDSYTLEKGFGNMNMNSFNHYAYGAVAEWMYSDLLGIKPDVDNPGFKHIILQPKPDLRTDEDIPKNQEKITSAKGTYDSAYGNINVEWSAKDGLFFYKVTIPANTTATLTMPKINSKSNAIIINGASYDLTTLKSNGCNSEGVKFVSSTDHELTFEISSGSYILSESVSPSENTK